MENLKKSKRHSEIDWPLKNMVGHFATWCCLIYTGYSFSEPKNKTVIVQKFYTLCFCLLTLPSAKQKNVGFFNSCVKWLSQRMKWMSASEKEQPVKCKNHNL